MPCISLLLISLVVFHIYFGFSFKIPMNLFFLFLRESVFYIFLKCFSAAAATSNACFHHLCMCEFCIQSFWLQLNKHNIQQELVCFLRCSSFQFPSIQHYVSLHLSNEEDEEWRNESIFTSLNRISTKKQIKSNELKIFISFFQQIIPIQMIWSQVGFFLFNF